MRQAEILMRPNTPHVLVRIDVTAPCIDMRAARRVDVNMAIPVRRDLRVDMRDAALQLLGNDFCGFLLR